MEKQPLIPVIIDGKEYCPCCSQLISKVGILPSSISEFLEASCVEDWINQTTESIYQIYVDWCSKNEYNAENKIVFMRGVLKERDDLKSTASHGTKYFRWK